MDRENVTENWADDPSTDSSEVQHEYDEFSSRYEQEVLDWDYDCHEIGADIMKDYVSPDARILDAGCGTGLVGQALWQRHFRHLDGNDISAVILEKARAKQVYNGLRQVDLLEPLPYQDNEYDAVCSIGVFSHVETYTVLDEFCRIVRPGGVIVFSQRDDLSAKYDFPTWLKSLDERGKWTQTFVTESLPYIAGNEEYQANNITAKYYVYTVI